MKKKIVLIGMMGSGKSTIGKILSKTLKLNFIDADILIEKKCGLKIKKIFDKYGERYFREKEEKIVLNVLLNDKTFCSIYCFKIKLGSLLFSNNVWNVASLKQINLPNSSV